MSVCRPLLKLLNEKSERISYVSFICEAIQKYTFRYDRNQVHGVDTRVQSLDCHVLTFGTGLT